MALLLLLALTAGSLVALAPAASAATSAVLPDAGCRASTLARNDDGSTALVPLPFAIDFFGTIRTGIYVNNNGDVTFDQPYPAYAGLDLASVGIPIIAPLFYDIDTRAPAATPVQYGVTTFEGRAAFCVNWLDVGYYNSQSDRLNRGQLLLVERSDTGDGNFDMVFGYDRIAYDDTGIVAGYSNGTDVTYTLPGSGSRALHDGSPTGLIHHSIGSTQPGRYVFPVRGGSPQAPGSNVIAFVTSPTATFGDAPRQLSATASSGLTVALDANGPCSLDGTALDFTGAGTCTVTATQAGDEEHDAAAPVVRTVTVAKTPVTITLGGTTTTYDGTPRPVTVAVAPDAAPAASVTYDGSTTPPTHAGTYTVVAASNGPDHAGSAAGTLVIAKAPQTIDVGPLALGVGDEPVTVDAAADSGLPVAVDADGDCELDGRELRATHSGTCTLTITQAGDGDHLPATQVLAIPVDTGDAALSVGSLHHVYDGTPRAVAVSTVPDDLEGVAVRYDGGLEEPTGAGTYEVEVTLTNDDWEASAVEAELVVARAPQTVSIAVDDEATFGDAPLPITATSSLGFTATLAASGPCRVSGGELVLRGAGRCVVTASQAGDVNHLPASSTVTVTIAKAPQRIELEAVPGLRHLGSPAPVRATSSSGLPVSLAVTGPCRVVGTELHPTAPGTCTLTATQAGSSDVRAAAPLVREVAVARAVQKLELGGPATARYGDSFAVTAAATSGLPVDLAAGGACAWRDGAVSATGVGPCELTARQDGDHLFEAAEPARVSVEIGRALQSIDLQLPRDLSWASPPPSSGVQARATSGLPVALSASGACAGASAAPVDVGTCRVTARQAGDRLHAPATEVTRSFSVVPGRASVLLRTSDGGDVDVRTEPTGLPVAVTYDGSTTKPTGPGTYRVEARIADRRWTAEVARATFTVAEPARPDEPEVTETEPASERAERASERGGKTGGRPAARTTDRPVVDAGTGEVVELAPGRTTASLRGRPVAVSTTARPGSIRLASGSVVLDVGAVDGAGRRSTADGASLVLERGGVVEVSATGFTPGTDVVVWLFSEPTRLGRITVAGDGSATGRFPMPADVPPGQHTLQVNGSSADGPRSLSLGVLLRDDAQPARWLAVDHPRTVVETQVTFFALLATLGGAGALPFGAAGGGLALPLATLPSTGTTTGAGGGRRKSGKVASAKVKHAKVADGNQRWGDASSTWRWPGVGRVDALSLRLPVALAARSPLLARIVADGSHLRAILGSLSLAFLPVGALVGALAAASTGVLPVPVVSLVVAGIVLGMVDAAAGAVAASVFVTILGATGQLDSADAVRGVLGVSALWFALPLAVGAARPLRRPPVHDLADLWYRGGDLVILPLLAAWSTQKVVGALPGLYGHDVALAGHADLVAVVVGVCLVGRILSESLVATLYPERLSAVQPARVPFSSVNQRLLALVFKVGMFVFVAAPFVGVRVELAIGAAIFLLPQLAKLWEDRFPNLPALHRVLPSGLLKVTVMLVIGRWIGGAVAGNVSDPARLVATSFVICALPGLVESALGLVGRESEERAQTWWHRIAGVGVVLLTIHTVLG